MDSSHHCDAEVVREAALLRFHHKDNAALLTIQMAHRSRLVDEGILRLQPLYVLSLCRQPNWKLIVWFSSDPVCAFQSMSNIANNMRKNVLFGTGNNVVIQDVRNLQLDGSLRYGFEKSKVKPSDWSGAVYAIETQEMGPSNGPQPLCHFWANESKFINLGPQPYAEKYTGVFARFTTEVTNVITALPFDLTHMRGTKPTRHRRYAPNILSNVNEPNLLAILNHPMQTVFERLSIGLVLVAAWDTLSKIPPNGSYQGLGGLVDHVTRLHPEILLPTIDVGAQFLLHPIERCAIDLMYAHFLVAGAKRVWVVIPQEHTKRVDEVISGEYHSIGAGNSRPLTPSDPDAVGGCYSGHRRLFLHPSFLVTRKIPFTITVQSPGDIVLIDGRAYSEAWDIGTNLVLRQRILTHSAALQAPAHVEYCDCPSAPKEPVDTANTIASWIHSAVPFLHMNTGDISASSDPKVVQFRSLLLCMFPGCM
jgi:hypothetical protein